MPYSQMANDTHDCAAKCNQGSGSPSDTEKFAACVQGCITSHFFSAGTAPTAAPGAPGASGTAAGSASATGTAAGMIFCYTLSLYHMLTNIQVPVRRPEPPLLLALALLVPPLPRLRQRLLALLAACKSVPRSLVSLVSWQLSLLCKWGCICRYFWQA